MYLEVPTLYALAVQRFYVNLSDTGLVFLKGTAQIPSHEIPDQVLSFKMLMQSKTFKNYQSGYKNTEIVF